MTDITPGNLFDLMGKLDLTLGKVSSRLERQEQRLQQQAYMAVQPSFVRIHGSVVANSSGFGVIAFDNKGPDQGFIWYLRKLFIGGITTTTTAAGRGDIFVSAMNLAQYTTLAQIGVADWVDQAASLPLVGDFSTGEVPLRLNEQLFIVISGGTSGQQYVAGGVIQNFQESAARQNWDL